MATIAVLITENVCFAVPATEAPAGFDGKTNGLVDQGTFDADRVTFEERDSLNKALVKANDSKLLNTKQQIVYEGGKILNIRGLKIIRSNDPTHIASFKIEIHRQTKKKGSE